MATLKVTKDFKLNTSEGIKQFRVGDKVDGQLAEHWYVKAHCQDDNLSDLAEAAIRDKTKDIIQSLVTSEKPLPKTDDINKALKEAGLPTINAEKRDELLKA